MRGDALINVLYLQSNSEIGGSDVSLLRIVENLDLSRFRPVVVLPSRGPLTKAFAERGAKVVVVGEMLKLTSRKGWLYHLRFIANYPGAVARLVRLIRRERIDLVHTNTLHNLYGCLAARLARLPHVWHVREIVWQSAAVRRLEVFLARRFADRVVAVSRAAAEMFRSRGGEYPPHLSVIWDGVSLSRFNPRNSGRRIRAELGLADDAPLVGLVGRLDEMKGADAFLRAVAMCREEFPEARYVICGGEVEGQEEVARLALRLAGELGLTDVVNFTGWRYAPDDMPEVHAALSILVSASTRPESFGLVLAEAMAAGKPVVATNHGGAREVCVGGETALLVPPRDPRRMADAILKLLRDPSKAAAMGRAGRERAERHFDERRQARELQLLYEDVLKRARQSGERRTKAKPAPVP
ncbi:MAG: glycosyltransferase [Pyrinomonadaceae bacterium]